MGRSRRSVSCVLDDTGPKQPRRRNSVYNNARTSAHIAPGGARCSGCMRSLTTCYNHLQDQSFLFVSFSFVWETLCFILVVSFLLSVCVFFMRWKRFLSDDRTFLRCSWSAQLVRSSRLLISSVHLACAARLLISSAHLVSSSPLLILYAHLVFSPRLLILSYKKH